MTVLSPLAVAIRRLADRSDLSFAEMHAAMSDVMDGKASDVQKSAFLTALRVKGETAEEISGAARAMRERVTALDVDPEGLVDTCGTGGDGRGTLNVSTLAALVASGAGAVVAKHGNRAVSSSCGSADFLSALGVDIDLDSVQMTMVLKEVGISFLFAPKLHPAMGAVAPVRRELGIRTIFNVLGPLTNPAGARRQVIGVYSRHLVAIVAEVLRTLGAVHALVVHSEDGLDEISISASTAVSELQNGVVRSYSITPEEIGVASHPIEAIGGDTPAENAAIARRVLAGEAGAPREIVVANGGAALYVAGLADSIANGVTLAKEAIDSGAASRKLEALIAVSNRVGSGR